MDKLVLCWKPFIILDGFGKFLCRPSLSRGFPYKSSLYPTGERVGQPSRIKNFAAADSAAIPTVETRTLVHDTSRSRAPACKL
jgi:hypothetical protein